jgi:hypothetical protein
MMLARRWHAIVSSLVVLLTVVGCSRAPAEVDGAATPAMASADVRSESDLDSSTDRPGSGTGTTAAGSTSDDVAIDDEVHRGSHDDGPHRRGGGQAESRPRAETGTGGNGARRPPAGGGDGAHGGRPAGGGDGGDRAGGGDRGDGGVVVAPFDPVPGPVAGAPVNIPNFQIEGALFYEQRSNVEDEIRSACGDGSLCVDIAIDVQDSPDPEVAPCTVLALPPEGEVERGSAITFVVAAPCQADGTEVGGTSGGNQTSAAGG